jgi:hypothetical protein
MEPGQLSNTALGYGLDDGGFESWQGLVIFLFTNVSRLALGPTQPPIQLVPGALSLGVKQPGHEADHSEVWCSIKKSTGITLPFTFSTVIL